MKLLELCQKYFGCNNLYEVLDISKDATPKEVRKAYHKLSLSCHPDRVEEDRKLEATEKFKVLSKIHEILSDDEKRTNYDENGTCDDEDEGSLDDRDWLAYWRLLFKKITVDDIKKFEQEYKGSDEELMDLKKAYIRSKGDMDKIFDSVPFVTLAEEDRIRARLQELIEKEEIEAYDIFINEPQAKRDRRIRKLRKEEKEAEKEAKLMEQQSSSGYNDLCQAILARRQESTEDFLSALEKKYGSPKLKEKSRKKSVGRKSKK